MALKAEGLQHLFVALAGSDCKELWTLLITFFGKGMGFDLFNFLDAAPAIKPPLDLGDTNSEGAEGESNVTSSVTIDSVSTTVSTSASAAPSTSAPTA